MAIVGGIGFLIQSTLFQALGFTLQVTRPSTAVLIGGQAALLSNFLLNGWFSFGDRSHATAPLYKRLLRFHVVALSSIVLQWLLVRAAELVVGYNPTILWTAYVLGVGVGFVFTYSGYHLWVWRKESLKEHEGAKAITWLPRYPRSDYRPPAR